ncbi:MAG: serine/threonine-protein kinase [Acidobacteriota bacterium]
MTPTSFQRVQELLGMCLEVDIARRRALLEAETSDPELIAKVLDLLEGEDDSFLGESPWQKLIRRRPVEGGSEPPALKIPGYTIRRVLGEGGMGRVFLAVEETTDKRLVAIKMIRTPIPDPDLIRRFNAERRAMSRLNHPSIAQLFGAGTTEDGRHFVVIEYVDGRPIHRYCDASTLTIAERLELFVEVCRGVEHAHRRQLLHRDLKPSNLLIAVRDGRPTPKIIDFGIARGLDRPLGENETVTGAVPVGTPAYMSPEALGPWDRRDLDTRTDVYSLGVVLYELLTGVRPFDQIGQDLVDWRRISAQDPPQPSRRVRRLSEEQRADTGRARGTDGRRLARRLEGDLDWIVLKALAADPEERYGSAAALADDLERTLRHEPVTARPPSLSDRLVKLGRRYRAATALALLTALAILTASVFTTIALVRTQKAEAAAVAEAAAAGQAIDFLVGLFEAAKPESAQGEDVSARELVVLGAEKLRGEKLPPLQRARLLHTLGEVQLRLGDYSSGRDLADEALGIREVRLGKTHVEVLETLDLLANLERRAGRLDEAEPHVERLVQARRAQGNPLELAAALNTLANLRWRQERLDEAETLHRSALELRIKVREDLRRQGQSDPAVEAALSASLNNLGVLLWSLKKFDEAELILRRAADEAEARLGADHPRVADLLGNLSLILYEDRRFEESLKLHRRVLAIRRRALGPRHPDTATAMENFANALTRLGRMDESEPLLILAREIRIEVLGHDHPLSSRSAHNLRSLYYRTGRTAEAQRIERLHPLIEPGNPLRLE